MPVPHLLHIGHVLVGLAILLCATAPARAQGRDLEGSLQFGGVKRTYRLHLPSGYDGKKSVALVIALHGGGATGRSMNNLAHFNAAADKHGFILVCPDGLYRHWNDGRQSGVAESKRVDDVGFLSALIDRMSRDYRIDPARVYATGISNGGFMSQRLACDLSERIVAVGVVAATMGEDLSKRCRPPRAVSVLVIQGTADPLVPYEGGRVNVRGGGFIVSARATVAKWVELNRCSTRPATHDLPDSANDGTRTSEETYSACKEGSEVTFLRVENGGHTWPGGLPYLPERMIGKTSRDFDATEVIWEFFEKHPRTK